MSGRIPYTKLAAHRRFGACDGNALWWPDNHDRTWNSALLCPWVYLVGRFEASFRTRVSFFDFEKNLGDRFLGFKLAWSPPEALLRF